MKLTLRRKHEEILIEGENGEDRIFTLREMTGSQRDVYLSRLNDNMVTDSNGNTSIRSTEGLTALLLSLSLSEKGQPVKVEEINDWPASTTQAIFEKAQQISALTEKAGAEAGNE